MLSRIPRPVGLVTFHEIIAGVPSRLIIFMMFFLTAKVAVQQSIRLICKLVSEFVSPKVEIYL